MRKFNGHGPMRGPRQTGFMPGHKGGAIGVNGGMRRGMMGSGFGPHFATGGGHGGFGRH